MNLQKAYPYSLKSLILYDINNKNFGWSIIIIFEWRNKNIHHVFHFSFISISSLFIIIILAPNLAFTSYGTIENLKSFWSRVFRLCVACSTHKKLIRYKSWYFLDFGICELKRISFQSMKCEKWFQLQRFVNVWLPSYNRNYSHLNAKCRRHCWLFSITKPFQFTKLQLQDYSIYRL